MRRKAPLVEFLILGWLALAILVAFYFTGLFDLANSLGRFGPFTLNLPTLLLAYFLAAFLYLGIRRLQDRGGLKAVPKLAPELELVHYALEHPPGAVAEGEPMGQHLQALTSFAVKMTGAQGAVMEVSDQGVITQAFASGSAVPYHGLKQRLNVGITSVCMDTRQTINVPDVSKDPRARQGPPSPGNTKSMALAPVRHGEMAHGVLRVFSSHSYAFDQHTLDALRLLGAYAGASLWRSTDPAMQKDLMAEYQASLVAAQEARARFEQLADNLHGVYWVTDLKRERFLYVNDAYEKVWGRSMESLIQSPQSWKDAIVAEDRARVEAALKQPEGRYDVDYRIRRPDQTFRVIHERAFPVRNEAGKTVAIAALAEDVTDQRAAESELAVLGRRVEHGFSHGPAMFYSGSPSGTYGLTFVSENVQTFLGHPAAAFTDDPTFWQARLHPDDQTRVFEAFPKLFEKGALAQEYRLQHKDGTYRLLRDDMRLVRDADGEPLEIVGYWVDVTDRKRAEEGLAYSLNRIKELQESRTRLLNNIAHDLSSPLTPIGLQLEMLKMSLGAATEKQSKSLEILLRNVAHLQRLIEDLKDLARLEAGQLKIDAKPTDLGELVEKAVETFREPAKEKGLALAAHVPQKNIAIVADEQRITQVVFNFLTNALKFSPPKGHIEVDVAVDAGQATVRVKDEGRGLTADEIAKLFKPFSQVHDRSQVKEKGTGLGLFICKGLIEKHGGTIWAESEGHGKGSTFAFTLPFEAATGDAPAAEPPHPRTRREVTAKK